MTKTMKLSILVLCLISGEALAQSTDRAERDSRAIAKAEQTALSAICRVDYLKAVKGQTSKPKLAYHQFMVGCLSKIAAQ